MSQEIFFRCLASVIFALIINWAVFSRCGYENRLESTQGNRQKYLPYISSTMLPIFILINGILDTLFYGVVSAAQLSLSMCFGIFLHISVYYVVLILILPFLRKYFSATACATLWIIPNYLYITSQSFMELPNPWIVIHAPGNIVWTIFFVWLAGFIIVLTWKTIEHLIFRHRILQPAYPVTNVDILAIRDNVLAEARMEQSKFQLVMSPKVKTPLSIGLFQRTTRVVLPEKDYTTEELELILRHEMIHIAREDSWSKYFLVFCTAMCWFNPLMWIAMKKSAEDMELSCDETVLLNADQNTRKKYATLLLDNASDDRGFTTCLATSAKSMRYRLKHIVKPEKRLNGAVIVGLVFFVLCMTSGYVALAYDDRSGSEVIYNNSDYSQYHLHSISMEDGANQGNGKLTDEAEVAFHEYLSELTLSELTGYYSFSEYDTQFSCLMDTPEGTQVVQLYDNVINITKLYGENPSRCYYYIQDGVDWEYLRDIVLLFN